MSDNSKMLLIKVCEVLFVVNVIFYYFQECKNSFKSRETLEHHVVITHDTGTDVGIAQQPCFNRKRPLDESHIPSEDNASINSSSPAHLDMNSTHLDTNPTHHETEAVSKLRRLDTHSPLLHYRSAIPPHLAVLAESSYDIQMKAYEASLKSTSMSEMSDLHVCQVCSKMFPKPSDLKRHMMCHTGEKPFRCEVSLQHVDIFSESIKFLKISINIYGCVSCSDLIYESSFQVCQVLKHQILFYQHFIKHCN